MYTITDRLKTPCQIDMEITGACNHSCRYCYNFWRHDDGTPITKMSKETLDKIIDDIIENKVFNVVLTGGEPFTNYDVLLHGVRRLTEAGILVSCNSNLTLATKEQLNELHDAGLPHIPTSLASYDPELNDFIFSSKGAFVKIIKNIINAVEAGIKISVNTVVSRSNMKQIYKTGLLVHALGAKNLFLTRVVPASSCTPEVAAEFVLEAEEYVPILDDAIKLRDETGINVGSLIQYPVCFLRDVEKYSDFLGRGCPAGKKMVCINANGETHGCFHEKESYGNVLEIGLKGVWENLEKWRDNSLIPEECRKCKWLRWCEAGCRIFADTLSSPDYMCRGKSDELPDPVEDWEKSIDLIDAGVFRVRKGLRFREEDGFHLAHIVGAWIAKISPAVAEFLSKYEKSGKAFTIKDFSGSREELADLVTKNIVEKTEG